MIVARIGSAGWDIVLILHLLSMVVAFAPAFVWPVLNRLQKVAAGQPEEAADRSGPTRRVGAAAVGHIIDPMMHGGALVLTGGFGVALIAMSGKAYEFSQTWISIAFVLWFLMLALFFAGLVPAQHSVREGKVAAESRLAMCYGGMHLLLLLQIIVMVWRPGL